MIFRSDCQQSKLSLHPHSTIFENTNLSKPTMEKKLAAFGRLLKIMDDLRSGCPWDKKQTLETLRYLTIEETYELSDAILENDMQEIKKELPKKFPKAIHVYSNTNLGFSGGNNLGLRKALKGKHNTFVLLNNDVLVDKNFIKTALFLFFSLKNR